MAYFNSFNNVLYQFGNEITTNVTQNLTVYSDVIDQIKDNISFYDKEYIQEGERPDQLALRLYDDPQYYWTFYLMNNDIRQRGWPIDQQQMYETIEEVFPHFTVTVREDITQKFDVGRDLIGQTSGARGTIDHKNYDLGQLIVTLDPGSEDFQVGEIVRSTNVSSEVQTAEAFGASKEYLAARYYLNGDGDIADFDPLVGPGSLLTEKTILDTWIEENDELRQIQVIKPEFLGRLESSFNTAVSEV